MTTALSVNEKMALAECEDVIEAGVKTFVEVGKALAMIRDRKLYKSGHDSFEAYCQERWKFTKTYANNLIAANSVMENLTTIVVTPPRTESQARPLAKLPPEEQPAAWTEANERAKEEGRPVTARHVEEVVARRIEKPEPSEPPKGKGLRMAQDAINILSRIPLNDPLRDMGLHEVTKWIKQNR